MWPAHFSLRLEAWNQLRVRASELPVDHALIEINRWWFAAPWTAYHLHWADRPTWPDPWQLLNDNIYCSLARGLGILYTITIIDRCDIQDAVLTEFNSDNLVLVDKEKYILNWDPTEIVNIDPGVRKKANSITQEQIKKQLR